MKRLITAATLLALAAPALAEPAQTVRVAWGNDVWADPPPADDNGFTNDLAVDLRRRLGERERDRLHVALLHRMITERWGPRRWDQVELGAGVERTWRRAAYAFAAEPRLGLALGGNFGGRVLQNGWHRYTGTGITTDEGLQDTYDGGRRAALLAGARATGSAAFGAVTPYAGVDAQAMLGSTGVSFLEAIAGARVEPRLGRAQLLVGLELAAARYHAGDPGLLLDGGYDTGGWRPAWRLALGVAWSRWQLGWQYRSSEGGSGEPIGVFWFAASR